MKTVYGAFVIIFLASGLFAGPVFGLTSPWKKDFDNLSRPIDTGASERHKKKSTKALMKEFDNVLKLAMFDKLQSIIDAGNGYSDLYDRTLAKYAGEVNVVFSVSSDRKIEVENILGENADLVLFVKEVLKKEPMNVPKAEKGKYLIPVRFQF